MRLGALEFGIQAMVDAIFDMTAQSFDLGNEDYFAGFTPRTAEATHAGADHRAPPRRRVAVRERPRPTERLLRGDRRAARTRKEVLRSTAWIYLNATPDYDPILTQWGFG